MQFVRHNRSRAVAHLVISVALAATGLVLTPASAIGSSANQTLPAIVDASISVQATSPGFDAEAPFVITGDPIFEPPHIDTDDGSAPSPQDIETIEALASHAPDPAPQNGFAYATMNQVFTWQGAGETDIDLTLTAITDIDDAIINIVHQSMLEYRQVINLELTEPASHKVEISWITLPAGTLAAASTTYVTASQDGQNFLIPLFLADSLTHSNNTAEPSFRIYINADVDWDLSLSPTDWTINKIYLKSVMLHEIGHGLGFTAAVGPASDVTTTRLTPWSEHLYVDQDLTRPYSSLRSSAIQTNNLWFASSDGTWERVYDPTTWKIGSSLSHLNETTYLPGPGTSYQPGAMMTPAAGVGEIGIVDGVIAGVLSRLGYETFMAPLAPGVEATYTDETLTVALSPQGAGLTYVPAKTWTVQLRNGANVTLDTKAVDAANSVVTFDGFLPNGAYSVVVTAETDGNTAMTNAGFSVSGSSPPTTTSTTLPGSTTVPSTTVPVTTVPITTVLTTTVLSTTSTSTPSSAPPTTSFPYYQSCSDVRSAGAAPILASNPSFRASFDTDNDGIGCERSVTAMVGEPQLQAEHPQLWYRFQIARLYNAYFGRYPDETGWQYWNARFVGDETLGEMSQFFSQSAEFRLLYGDELTNAEFVALVYDNVLQRQGEPSGMAFWESRLDEGINRGELMIGFSESIEFIYNSGPISTNSCWSATDPFDTVGLRASYGCAAGETPAPA